MKKGNYKIISSRVPSDVFAGDNPATDSDHMVLDAGLKSNATLHRFTDKKGKKYSAIYIGMEEMRSCYRECEGQMIRDWNTEMAV